MTESNKAHNACANEEIFKDINITAKSQFNQKQKKNLLALQRNIRCVKDSLKSYVNFQESLNPEARMITLVDKISLLVNIGNVAAQTYIDEFTPEDCNIEDQKRLKDCHQNTEDITEILTSICKDFVRSLQRQSKRDSDEEDG